MESIEELLKQEECSLTANDIVQQKSSEVFSVHPHTYLFEALTLLREKSIGALIVSGDDHTIHGIVSERDMLKYFAGSPNWNTTTQIQDIMTPRERVLSVPPDDNIRSIMTLMIENHIRHLPVVEEGKLVGILSMRDVIKALLDDVTHQKQLLLDFIYTDICLYAADV